MRYLFIYLFIISTNIAAQNLVTELPKKDFSMLGEHGKMAIPEPGDLHYVPCPHQSWRLLPPYHVQIDLRIDTFGRTTTISGPCEGKYVGAEIVAQNANCDFGTEFKICKVRDIWPWIDTCLSPVIVGDLINLYHDFYSEKIKVKSMGYAQIIHTAVPFIPMDDHYDIRHGSTANDYLTPNPYFGWFRKVRPDGTIVAVKQISNIEWLVSFALFLK